MVTRDGFNSRWRKAKEQAAINHPELSFDFTFHDLKAKGISDLDGTLQEKQKYQDIKILDKRLDMIERLK